MTVEEKFELAKVLLRRCTQELVALGVAADAVSVTVIVAAADPYTASPELALVTTLADGSSLRPLLASYIVDTSMRDHGIDPAAASDHVNAECDRINRSR